MPTVPKVAPPAAPPCRSTFGRAACGRLRGLHRHPRLRGLHFLAVALNGLRSYGTDAKRADYCDGESREIRPDFILDEVANRTGMARGQLLKASFFRVYSCHVRRVYPHVVAPTANFRDDIASYSSFSIGGKGPNAVVISEFA